MAKVRMVALSIVVMLVAAGCFGPGTNTDRTSPIQIVRQFATKLGELDADGMLAYMDDEVQVGATIFDELEEEDLRTLPKEVVAEDMTFVPDGWTATITLSDLKATESGNEAVVTGKFEITVSDGEHEGGGSADVRIDLKKIGGEWLITGLYITNQVPIGIRNDDEL